MTEAEKAIVAEYIAQQEESVRANQRYDLTAITANHDTPASRRLLEALVAAQEAAEEVDKERGHFVDFEPQIPGESKGTGYAESLSELAFRLRREIAAPPKGRGE